MKVRDLGLFVSMLLAISIASCSPQYAGVLPAAPGASVAGVAQLPPPIAAGDVVGLYPGSTNRLLDLAIKGEQGAQLYYQETTGNTTAFREIYDDMWEFTCFNVKDLNNCTGSLTGNVARTKDWQGIKTMLEDLGFKIVSGVEFASYYTTQAFLQFVSNATPTILVLPIGVDGELYNAIIQEGIDQ